MPEVLNKSWNKIPKESVYIGRPSKWGNPFSHKVGTLAKYKVSSREEAVQKHKEWLDALLATMTHIVNVAVREYHKSLSSKNKDTHAKENIK